MSDFNITLKSVYSCPACEIPKGVQLPQGWVLSWHQVATLEALDLDYMRKRLQKLP